jgi:hypothetical protein
MEARENAVSFRHRDGNLKLKELRLSAATLELKCRDITIKAFGSDGDGREMWSC